MADVSRSSSLSLPLIPDPPAPYAASAASGPFALIRSTSAEFETYLGRSFELRSLPTKDEGQLDRGLGMLELILLGIGACIGAGIFVLTGVEAHVAGPSVTLSFMLAAMSSIFNGLCYAELATRLPISGSAYLYTYCMFGELPAMIVVANLLIDYHIGAATTSRSLTAYLATSLESLGIPVHPCFVGCTPFESAPWISISIGAPLVLLAVAFVVAQGAKENAAVTATMTVMKIGIVLVVIIVGMGITDPVRWVDFFPSGFSATLQAAATLNYAYIGYDVIANAAEETRDPQRNIPGAIIGTLMVCAALYVTMCLVLCGMQNAEDIDLSAPISSAFVQFGMLRISSIIDLGAFVGLLTCLLAGVYGQSRVYFALSRDRMAPQWLHSTPHCCTWCGCLAATLAALFDVSQLASFLNIGVLTSYAMTAASVLFINTCSHRTEGTVVLTVAGLSIWLALATKLHSSLVWLAMLGLVCVICLAAVTRSYTCSPSGTFHCPFVPVVPLVAFVANVYLAGELNWHAWARLVVVTIVVVVGHCTFTCLGLLDGWKRKSQVCQTVQAAAQSAGTNTGLCKPAQCACSPLPSPGGVIGGLSSSPYSAGRRSYQTPSTAA